MPDAIRLVTLPLRFGVRAAELVLDPLVGAAKQVLGRDGEEPEVEWSRPRPPRPAAGEAAGGAAAVAGAGPAADARPAAEAEPGLRESEPGGAPDADPPSALAEPLVADEPDEPEHVSTEAVLVAESADPEIADGIHTDLHVAEPWDGYRTQNAAEVIEALRTASPAQIGVVQLYETTHRRRKTVLEAAERALRESAS